MLNEEGLRHILLACVETRFRRMTFLIKEENVCIRIKKASYRKILICINKGQERNLGTFLSKLKYRFFNKMNKCKYIS